MTVNAIANGIQHTSLDGNGAPKPHLVIATSAIVGHLTPLLKIGTELLSRGFPMTFVTGEQFESNIPKGAGFVPIPDALPAAIEPTRSAVPPGLPRLLWDMREVFLGSMPHQWEALRTTLETVKAADPDRPVVVVTEIFFQGHHPLLYGAPLPRGYTTRPKVLAACTAPMCLTSEVTGPFGPGLPPGDTDACRARNMLIDQIFNTGPWAEVLAAEKQMIADLGGSCPFTGGLFHNWYTASDRTLQLCPPSAEYARPDMPSHVKFAGCMTPRPLGADVKLPPWWAEATSGQKRIVVVTQGTVAVDYTDLLIPTMEALKDREDVLVVAILGVKGASLPVAVPSNARVVDYLPYDAILPHASVAVLNAGYGGYLHGIINGVPMVLAGGTEDKPEVAMRGEVLGLGRNMRTASPEVGQLREAIGEILADPAHKKRVMAVKMENEELDVLAQFEKHIMECV